MTSERFLELMNGPRPGVGAVFTYKDGSKNLFFYEDFNGADSNTPFDEDQTDRGITRAAKQATKLIEAGKLSKAEYIYKSPAHVWFWDWTTKPGTFCAADEYRNFCKSHNLELWTHYQRYYTKVCNKVYMLDYTPAINGISAIIFKEDRP